MQAQSLCCRDFESARLLTRVPGEARVDFDTFGCYRRCKQTAHYLPKATPHLAGCFVVALQAEP
jgi:hypothetical protein